MCGRFTREFTWRQVHDFLNLKFPAAAEMKPSYNVAPTQDVLVCTAGDDRRRELRIMRWGLIPFWSKDAAKSYINARCETVGESSAFQQSFEKRRCLVPASGFYEWANSSRGKTPYYIQVVDQPIICFAGIWSPWRPEDDQKPIETVAIITTRSNTVIADIHDRMPVILDPRHFDRWLLDDQPDRRMFEPPPAARMRMHMVSTRVNSPRNNDERLTLPASDVGDQRQMFLNDR